MWKLGAGSFGMVRCCLIACPALALASSALRLSMFQRKCRNKHLTCRCDFMTACVAVLPRQPVNLEAQCLLHTAVQVYKALQRDGQPVAVKVIPFDATDQQRADFDKEVWSLLCSERQLMTWQSLCIHLPGWSPAIELLRASEQVT